MKVQLKLNKETIRNLQDEDLRRVAGGESGNTDCYCTRPFICAHSQQPGGKDDPPLCAATQTCPLQCITTK